MKTPPIVSPPPHRLAFTWLWDGEAVRSPEGGWGTAFDNLDRTLTASEEAR